MKLRVWMLAVALAAGAVNGCSSVDVEGDDPGGSSADALGKGEVTVTVSNLTDSENKILLLMGVVDGETSIFFAACESITADPATTSTPLRIRTGDTPCDTGDVATIPSGELTVHAATLIGGQKDLFKCSSANAIVDGDISVALPEFDVDCSNFPKGD